MRNIRLDVEYDGRNYCGWQWQTGLNTIEGTLKSAIEKMVGHTITLWSSGRTDSGVHAEQHVAHFKSESQLPEWKFLYGLNCLTPPDIAIKCVRDMPLHWSARHDAVEREYRYTFYNHRLPNVFFQHHCYWEKGNMNAGAMREAASHLVGKHDFSAFRSQHCDADNPVRTILELSVIEDQPFIHLKIRGHAFLRNQVRVIAGALRKVGLGWKPPMYVKERLESTVRDSTDETLDACGLTLVAVRYKEDAPDAPVYTGFSRFFL